MSYQVLARKWRPHNFTDMVGQEAILRMMSNALDQQRIHHAYLFTGTRGVGKTTLARILAKCLNCESGVTSKPCGECNTCKAVDAGQFLDLYEIDAASRTKVEDTRELLDNVMYPPSQGRYKIYLIDEVHMLSNHSFNALLKTLEEPPQHVKFLLATTDPKKLPVTVLSRCLQFHLKRILPEQISGHLEHICKTEKIEHDTNALQRLAIAADGSMRDALSLLDQAIAYGHGAVTLEDVAIMLGSMSLDDILPLIEALAAKDGNTILTTIKELAERAPDFSQVLEEIINVFHQAAIAQIVPEHAQEGAISKLAQTFSPEDIQLYYQIALLGRRDLIHAISPQQGFEMTMLRMLAFKPELTQKVSQNSQQPQKTVKSEKITQTAAPTAKPEKTAAKDIPSTADNDKWHAALPQLGLSGMTYALASNCSLTALTDNSITLALGVSHQAMLNENSKQRLKAAINQHFGKEMHLEVNITKEELATPVKQQQKEHASKLAAATDSMMKDPKVKQLIDTYDATIEVSLV